MTMILPSFAKHQYKESEYQKVWCQLNHGILEYQNFDKTRVDCLTDKYAIEFDFASKWAEGIGQSLYYSLLTKKEPMLILIIEHPKKDSKYVQRAKVLGETYGIKVTEIDSKIFK